MLDKFLFTRLYIALSLNVICLLSFQEFHAILNSLKTESGSRDQDLRVLKENVSKIKEGIAELSSNINCFKNEDISLTRNRDSDKSKETVDRTINREPKPRTFTSLAESGRNVSATANEERSSQQASSKQQEDIQLQGSPERPPLSRNKYGLKYRSVSIKNDNRVKVLEGKERETPQSFQNKPSPQTGDELNLPTRDALKKHQSTQKANGTKPRTKQ